MALETLGGQQLACPKKLLEFCTQKRLVTEHWLGKANGYHCPVGSTPGEGWVLLAKKHLDLLDLSALHDLHLRLPGTEIAGKQPPSDRDVTLKSLTIISTESATPGLRGDVNEHRLVYLKDRRHLYQKIPVDAGYNLKKTPSGDYYTASLNVGVAWTWTQIAQNLWETVGTSNLGAYPSLPFTPEGTPEDFEYWQMSAMAALDDFLKRIGCRLRLDPITDQFSIVQIGATQTGFTTSLATWDGFRVWDEDPTQGYLARIPASVRVLFRKRPPVPGSSPYYAVNVADPTADAVATGTQAGTYALIHDDLTALYDEAGAGPSNAAALSTRATDRATDYYRQLWRGSPLYRYVWALPLEDDGFRPGSQVRETRWYDRGRGLRTEILRFEDIPDRTWPELENESTNTYNVVYEGGTVTFSNVDVSFNGDTLDLDNDTLDIDVSVFNFNGDTLNISNTFFNYDSDLLVPVDQATNVCPISTDYGAPTNSDYLEAAYEVMADDTWEDTGLEVTLPTAGSYLVTCQLRGIVEASGTMPARLKCRLYNVTDGAPLSQSEAVVAVSHVANVPVEDGAPLVRIVSPSNLLVIRLEAHRNSGSTWVQHSLLSDIDGWCRLAYIRAPEQTDITGINVEYDTWNLPPGTQWVDTWCVIDPTDCCTPVSVAPAVQNLGVVIPEPAVTAETGFTLPTGCGCEAIPTLFNTGVDSLGNRLTTHNGVDPHWTANIDGGGAGDAYAMVNDNVAWVPNNNSDGSIWISSIPDGNEDSAGAGTTVVFTTTFTMPVGVDPDNLCIAGRFLADDAVTEIRVNGVDQGIGGGGYIEWLPPSGGMTMHLTSGFTAGVNTIAITVYNPTPTTPLGLRVEWRCDSDTGLTVDLPPPAVTGGIGVSPAAQNLGVVVPAPSVDPGA